MEDKKAIVEGKTEEMQTFIPEPDDIITFDKNAMKKDLEQSLKDFGIRCCEAGKLSLAPLASTMLKHFFSWVICRLQ